MWHFSSFLSGAAMFYAYKRDYKEEFDFHFLHCSSILAVCERLILLHTYHSTVAKHDMTRSLLLGESRKGHMVPATWRRYCADCRYLLETRIPRGTGVPTTEADLYPRTQITVYKGKCTFPVSWLQYDNALLLTVAGSACVNIVRFRVCWTCRWGESFHRPPAETDYCMQ